VSVADVGYRTRVRELELPTGVLRVHEVAEIDAVLDAAAEGDLAAPYGVVLWPSGVALAHAVSNHALDGRVVIDVGAGVGAASLAAARCGARVVALDFDPLSLRLIALSASEHELNVSTERFDLYDEAPLPEGDLYLFADMLYEPPLAERCAERVLECLSRGACVLLADPDRVGRATFIDRLRHAGVDAIFEDTHARVPGDKKPSRVGVLRLQGGR
jgi:predicted nicotinamide N-methyase